VELLGLYRNFKKRWISGVCAGLADFFEIDVFLIRLAAVLATWATGGATILVYLIGVAIIPRDQR
jgi:phage shock protein C